MNIPRLNNQICMAGTSTSWTEQLWEPQAFQYDAVIVRLHEPYPVYLPNKCHPHI